VAPPELRRRLSPAASPPGLASGDNGVRRIGSWVFLRDLRRPARQAARLAQPYFLPFGGGAVRWQFFAAGGWRCWTVVVGVTLLLSPVCVAASWQPDSGSARRFLAGRSWNGSPRSGRGDRSRCHGAVWRPVCWRLAANGRKLAPGALAALAVGWGVIALLIRGDQWHSTWDQPSLPRNCLNALVAYDKRRFLEDRGDYAFCLLLALADPGDSEYLIPKTGPALEEWLSSRFDWAAISNNRAYYHPQSKRRIPRGKIDTQTSEISQGRRPASPAPAFERDGGGSLPRLLTFVSFVIVLWSISRNWRSSASLRTGGRAHLDCYSPVATGVAWKLQANSSWRLISLRGTGSTIRNNAEFDRLLRGEPTGRQRGWPPAQWGDRFNFTTGLIIWEAMIQVIQAFLTTTSPAFLPWLW